MYKYKLPNGKIFNVSEANRREFESIHRDAVLVSEPKQKQPQTQTTGDMQKYTVGDKTYNVAADNVSDFVQHFGKDNVKAFTEKTKEIKHISAEELEDAIGTNWGFLTAGMEEKAAPFLTDYYRNQDIDVKFVESRVGHNALKMIVDGEEVGEDITLHRAGKAVDFKDLQAHIANAVEDARGDKEAKESRYGELLNLMQENPGLINALESDDTPTNKAAFGHTWDIAQGLVIKDEDAVGEIEGLSSAVSAMEKAHRGKDGER